MKKIVTLLLCAAMLIGVFSGTAVSAEGERVPLAPLDSSTIVLDREAMLVKRVVGIPTVSELAAQFENDPADLAVTDPKGKALGGGDTVPNGSTLTCRTADGEESFTVVISGDANSDGKLTVVDATNIIRALAGHFKPDPNGSYDADCDGNTTVNDAVTLLRYLANWSVTVGAENIVYTEEALILPTDIEDLTLCFGNDLDKISKEKLARTGKNTDTIRIAKNEIGFTQLFLSSLVNIDGLSISISPFTSQKGDTLKTELLWEHYYEVIDAATKLPAVYADALPPVESEFSIESLSSQGFVIKAHTTADSTAGLYRATVTVRQDGTIVKKAYVYADVWDFALSDDTACATAFGMSKYEIYVDYRQYENDDEVLYRAYYDFLLENRVSAYHMPFEVLDERADEYMSNPRVTSFMIDGRDGQFEAMTDGELAESYEKLSANEDWMSKGYFYYVDEPGNYDSFLEVEKSALRLREFFPDYRLVVPYYVNPTIRGKDLTANLSEYVTLWCPEASFWTPIDCTVNGAVKKFDQRAVDTYGNAETRFAAEVAGGDDLWWYVCINPQYPYPNFFATYQGTLTRVLFWQTYMYDIQGVLYWSVTSWMGSSEWRKMDGEFPYGDGRLIYSGRKYGLREPISSIRLEQVRDGIEDYQYMYMIEELYGSEKVDELIAKVTTGILEYSSDSEVLRSVRNEMGDLLENYFKGQ